MNSITVHICENDDYGNHSGFATSLMFYTENPNERFLHLECRYFEGGRIKVLRNGILHMYGLDFIFSSYGNEVGNICWNQYIMHASFALGLINLICRKHEFVCSEAWSHIARKWDTGQEITAFDIGINDKTVVQETIDPNQLDLFEKPFFCSNENYLGKRYRCATACGKDGQCEVTE